MIYPIASNERLSGILCYQLSVHDGASAMNRERERLQSCVCLLVISCHSTPQQINIILYTIIELESYCIRVSHLSLSRARTSTSNRVGSQSDSTLLGQATRAVAHQAHSLELNGLIHHHPLVHCSWFSYMCVCVCERMRTKRERKKDHEIKGHLCICLDDVCLYSESTEEGTSDATVDLNSTRG